MKAYGYNGAGLFTGVCGCQRDPVRSAAEGRDRFLIPANATTVAPPAFDPETQDCIWDGEAWRVSDRPVPPEPEPAEEQPSALDRLEAQVMWTAMLTDTLLEEV